MRLTLCSNGHIYPATPYQEQEGQEGGVEEVARRMKHLAPGTRHYST